MRCLGEALFKYYFYLNHIRNPNGNNVVYEYEGKPCLNCYNYGDKLTVDGVLISTLHYDHNHSQSRSTSWDEYTHLVNWISLNQKTYERKAKCGIIRIHRDYMITMGFIICNNCKYCHYIQKYNPEYLI